MTSSFRVTKHATTITLDVLPTVFRCVATISTIIADLCTACINGMASITTTFARYARIRFVATTTTFAATIGRITETTICSVATHVAKRAKLCSAIRCKMTNIATFATLFRCFRSSFTLFCCGNATGWCLMGGCLLLSFSGNVITRASCLTCRAISLRRAHIFACQFRCAQFAMCGQGRFLHNNIVHFSVSVPTETHSVIFLLQENALQKFFFMSVLV